MIQYRPSGNLKLLPSHSGTRFVCLMLISLGIASHLLPAQDAERERLMLQMQKLNEAVTRTQTQLTESQYELEELRRELAALQLEMGKNAITPVASLPLSQANIGTESPPTPTETTAKLNTAIDEIRERQDVQESQIATHAQSKVESQSKYPVVITGMLLFNGFVNTQGVDQSATPTRALGGPGTTGASVRQTILGFDAHGPHLFGAQSYADLRVDFSGNSQPGSTNTSGLSYVSSGGISLRLRTAHAGLHWQSSDAYFAIDKPIISPDEPTSLTAVAEPALAWSGNLWTWNPQVGAKRDITLGEAHNLRLQAALIDAGNAPYSFSNTTSGSYPVQTAEQSRWPGVETRIALFAPEHDREGTHLGIGGYFSPHRTLSGYQYNSWATTMDGELRLPHSMEVSGSAYRGIALGGLGGGAYKDFAYRVDVESDGTYYLYRALDNVGGWTQLKIKPSSRLEFNAAFGLDEIFAHEFRPYAVVGGTVVQNLAANRTYIGNFIYSPSSWLLFSFEYRHLISTPVTGTTAVSNIIGLAAGYRF